MIDSQKIKAIELLISGEHTVTRIGELVGVSRQTIYNWMNDDEFTTEWNTRLQQLKTMAQKEFDAKLNKAIDLYWELATSDKTDNRTKQVALSYIIDRSLGKTTSRLEMTDDRADTNVSDTDILTAIDEVDNVIDIKKAK
ncbi:MAG: phBC6A51 family helix-turn-helix protein [Bacilli bacterium]|nr:phBC6A51 family helix-turn-helix protein [Bacilli bacterium]